jgi:lipoate-protein ligase A
MFLKKSRFIPFGYYSPYENMAIDEYLISYYERTLTPVLRLYGWNPSGISAGKNQEVLRDLDLERCRKDSVPVVRRMTGGGAIFHGNEVTYSIVCSPRDLSKNDLSVKESFEKLNAFIIKMYSKSGLAAGYARDIKPAGTKLGTPAAFCFASSEEYDIIINNKKIGGNAQSRKKKLIFQHGSIPVKLNQRAMDYFIKKEDSSNYTDLSSLLNRAVLPEEVCANMIAAYAETFSCSLEEIKLDMDEKREVVSLLTSRYAVNNWNLKQ